MLLQLIANDECDVSIKQAVAAFFKNRVISAWDNSSKPGTATVQVGPNDKKFIKDNIISLMVRIPEKLRKLMAASLCTILQTEYPSNWPEFVPSIIQLLQTRDNTNSLKSGLTFLWELVSVYRFKSEERRAPLFVIVEQTFGALLEISNLIIGNHDSIDAESGDMMHSILKIYYSSMQYELSPIQQDPKSLIPWGNVFMQMIEKDLSGLPANIDRDEHPWWKSKKCKQN